MKRVSASIAAICLLAACSARTPPVTLNPSPSVSVTASTSSSPVRRVHVPVATFAVYMVGGAMWVYDAKANRASELARGGNLRSPKWVNKAEISFVQTATDGSETLRVLNVQTRKIRDLFSVSGGINVYGFSPDRETVAYVTTDSQSYPHLVFRSLSTGAMQTVGTLARALGRGGTASDSERIEFSSGGEYVLVVYTPADGDEGQRIPSEQSQLQVRTIDGSLAVAGPATREPTMGVWLPDGKTVLYRDDRGIHSWNAPAGAVKLVRTRLRWFDPYVSRDGRQVAFDSGFESPDVRVKLFDVRARSVKTISKAGRAFPVFAGPTTIWSQLVKPCKGECLLPTEVVNQVYALDIRTGRERPLALQSLSEIDLFYE